MATGESSAGVVIIGNEVLSGKVEEENARYLIKELRGIGVQLMRVVFIRDEIMTIADDVAQMSARYDHVFTTGGVGSTHDDITFEAVARALDLPLEIHPELEAMLVQHYGERMNEAVRRMALMPRGTEILGVGELRYPIAKCKNVYILPGVPSFLRIKFEYLRTRLSAGQPFVLKNVYLNVAEDQIAILLREVAERHADVEFGSYPRFDTDAYKVKITVESRAEARVAEGLAALLARLDPAWVLRVE